MKIELPKELDGYKKFFVVIYTLDETDKMCIQSAGKGFSAIEVLGLIEKKKMDLLSQIVGEVKPDNTYRDVIGYNEGVTK